MTRHTDKMEVMDYINAHPDTRAGAIADALGMTVQEVTGHLIRLKGEGRIKPVYAVQKRVVRLWRPS